MSNDPFNPYEGTDNTQPVPPAESPADSAPQSPSQNEGANAYQEPGAPYQAPTGQPTPVRLSASLPGTKRFFCLSAFLSGASAE